MSGSTSPHAEALTRFLPGIRSAHAAAQVQDRLRGCPADHTGRRSTTSASARTRPRRRARLQVTAGGGMAILCASGGVLHEFLPASRFSRRRGRAARVPPPRRLPAQAAQPHKFLIKVIGWTRWREERSRAVALPAPGRVPALEIETAGGEPGSTAREMPRPPPETSRRVRRRRREGSGNHPGRHPLFA
jgi:hypothetical protein